MAASSASSAFGSAVTSLRSRSRSDRSPSLGTDRHPFARSHRHCAGDERFQWCRASNANLTPTRYQPGDSPLTRSHRRHPAPPRATIPVVSFDAARRSPRGASVARRVPDVDVQALSRRQTSQQIPQARNASGPIELTGRATSGSTDASHQCPVNSEALAAATSGLNPRSPCAA